MRRPTRFDEAGTLQAAKDALPGDQMLVELTAVIAAYNMVSRMIVVSGLQVEQ